MKIPLGRGAYERTYGREPVIQVVNRFFEENPTNLEDGTSLLSRPATTLLTSIGDGPIRAMFTQEGTFGGALFVVSGTSLYRLNKDMTLQPITGTVAGEGSPVMCATATHLFICDGTALQYYDGDEVFATSVLTLTANPTNGETVTIGADVYTFVSALTGGGGAPYEVLIGANASASIDNLIAAINAGAGAGTLYGDGTPESTYVGASAGAGDTMDVTAVLGGAAANSIATTETLANGSWTGATLAGGVNGTLTAIATPDNVGIVSIDILAQQVLCVVSNSQRFYWILPGEVTIDPLNFAEAEQQPDELISVRVIGDRAFMFGTKTTEVWTANPAPDNASENFVRQQGYAFSRGILEGTDVAIEDTLIVVGEDGIIYAVGGEIQRISNHGVEEQIRLAIKAEREGA